MLSRGLLEKVPCELLYNKGIVGLIAIEGADDIVPVGRHTPSLVTMVTMAIGVSCEVEPHDCHPLSKMRRGEKVVDGGLSI